jgi:hypothetical protein
MLMFHDEIPEIAGQRCEALIGQQYWYRGELTGDPDVLFLKLTDDSWHKVFIDAGVLFWKLVDGPDPPAEDVDYGFKWTLTDVGGSRGLVGKVLRSITTHDLPGGGELRFDFDGAPTLILRDVDDQSYLLTAP